MEASATAASASGHIPAERSGPERLALARRVERRITVAMVLAHVVGALDLFALMFFVLPSPAGFDPVDHLVPNLVALAVYLPLATIVGTIVGKGNSPERSAWVLEGRDPTPQERADVLGAPMHCLRLDAGLWLGGLVLFTAVNLASSATGAAHIATTILLGGLTTCAVAYLLVERYMRPITELALASGPPPRAAWPGVEGRIVLAWAAVTASPLLGLVLLGTHGLLDAHASLETVSRSVLVLGIVAIALGLWVMVLAARSVSEPLTGLRRAQARVEAGDLSAGVRVTDASEVGVLQSGFNRMVEGLRERDRVRDLYSRQVGEDVAEATLDGEPSLGGTVCDVAVLFVDMVGSTRLAADLPPERVVERLNRFFAIVVDSVGAHEGWVNKFEGDAALCVFGAPVGVEDAAGCALAAARDLRSRLRSEMPSADAGIGLSAGPAVAGWIGAEQRFEYTVIGDPVNEAARLCELAKRRPERVLASQAILDRASGAESERWAVHDETVLRGRTTPTRLATPVV